MEMTLLGYLFLSSLYLLIFWAVYRISLSKLTFFQYQRVYILLAVLASMYLPLLSTSSFLSSILAETNNIPVADAYPSWLANLFNANPVIGDSYGGGVNFQPMDESNQRLEKSTIEVFNYDVLLFLILTLTYFVGFLIKFFSFFKKLYSILRLIWCNTKVKEGKYWMVYLSGKPTFSSFFRFIFLNDSIHQLTAFELSQIKRHEQAHSQQWHSLDILCLEFFKVIFWFHPLIYSFTNYLKDVHEYAVDSLMVNKVDKKAYAQLLLKLSNAQSVSKLATDFSNKQTGRRITMLAAIPSTSFHKLKFLLVIPLVSSLLLFSAFLIDEPALPKFDFGTAGISAAQTQDFYKHNTYVIDKINWQGSKLFTDEELSLALNIKEGEEIETAMLNRRFNEVENNTIYLSQLYATEGLAFGEIRTELVEFKDDKLTVTIKIAERGEFYLKIGQITWEGNTVYSDEELSTALKLKTGDDYNKEILNKRLLWADDGTDISSLYLNEGYAFFNVQEEEVRNGNTVNLVLTVFEGPIVRIAEVKISGNKTISTNDLMSKIQIKAGDKFSRNKIIAAQKMFFEMKEFDPMKIGIATPILEDNNQLMNIEFTLVEVDK